MPFDVAERYFYFAKQLDNHEIDADTYRHEVAMLPGYPLDRLLTGGDDLTIEIVKRTITSGGHTKKPLNQISN